MSRATGFPRSGTAARRRGPLRRPAFIAALLAVVGTLAGATADPEGSGSAPEPARATFAGGCFWCMEPPYDELPGVISTTSGYIGGHRENPGYEEVTRGTTGHAEAVQVVFDPDRITYAQLLDVFWRNIDPLTADRQFCDAGNQYRSAIFYHDPEQQRLAEASLQQVAGRFEAPIVTEISAATRFYPAEDYHQDYYQKNPLRYRFYRYNCGRDARLRELWGDEAGG